MRLKNLLLRIGFSTLFIMFTAGCSQTESLEQSFNDAPFSTRQTLDEAIRLDRSGDWMGAAKCYTRLLHQAETARQKTLVQGAIQRLYSRMVKAARSGDLEAKSTLDFIESQRKSG